MVPPPTKNALVPSWSTCPSEIQDHVLSYLFVAHLLMLGATSRHNYDIVKGHLRARVRDLLCAWNLPPFFLEFMQQYNIIFSGSAILALLMPDSLVPNDLDVYIPLGLLTLVQHFIEANTGYLLTPKTLAAIQQATDAYVTGNPANTGVRDVVFYRHATSHKILNIIECTDIVTPSAIFKFHSTFVMNYLTSNALVVGYPNMTTAHVGLVNIATVDLPWRLIRCLLKYGVRGFRALHRAYDWKRVPHDCATYPYCGRCRRSVGDDHTMRVALSSDVGSQTNVIDHDLTWTLGCRYNCSAQRAVDLYRGSVSHS